MKIFLLFLTEFFSSKTENRVTLLCDDLLAACHVVDLCSIVITVLVFLSDKAQFTKLGNQTI